MPLLQQIRGLGKKVGLAFNPDYPVERIEPYLPDIDIALCMTVFPGFGGQAYIGDSDARIRHVRKLIDRSNPKCELEVDGGIDRATIVRAAESGATVFVAGTAVFGTAEGPAESTRRLIALARR